MARTGRRKFEADLQQVEELAKQGLTKDQIATSLGVHRSTLFEKINHDADFSDAVKRGKTQAIKVAANVIFQQVEKGNIVAAMFWLKTQAGWREGQVLEHTGDVAVRELNLSPEHCQRLAESFLRRQATKR